MLNRKDMNMRTVIMASLLCISFGSWSSDSSHGISERLDILQSAVPKCCENIESLNKQTEIQMERWMELSEKQ